MTRFVIVMCPECGSIVEGKVERWYPWDIYSAECDNCGYIIMESEWEEINDKRNID
jgi:ribosomal protein S27E